jgi:asparagine synthase (glutamine-hydrolysing)
MRYRGPDQQLIKHEAGFSVGLARLAIIDTNCPEAEQPHRTAKGRIVAFNGEIYNYKNLSPAARSEVELLGAMLDERLDPRQFVDGDYAIIYFSPSQKLITLYRDRFGMCPLYFQVHPFVAVSSERRRLKGKVREVPAHGKVVIDLTKRAVTEENSIPHYGIICASSATDEIDTAETLLLDAVASRATHSDMGFSATLSGGLDSSAIILACSALGLKPSKAITVVAPQNSDDLRYAELVAREADVDLEVIKVTQEMMDHAVPEILKHLDHPGHLPTPLKWRASVRNWFAAAASPTRVLLCGEGADEVIEGYPPHTLRHAATPYRIAARQLVALRSLPVINLDRTNKLGLAHSIEYRAPFLASTLSYWLMSATRDPGKGLLRNVLGRLGAPRELLTRPKWGSDEKYFDESFAKIPKGEQHVSNG